MTTHTCILGWRIPWKEEPDATVHGVAEMDITDQLMLSLPNYFQLYLNSWLLFLL